MAPRVTLSSGLSYRDEVIGTGEPVAAGRLVIVRYLGKWLSGKTFDTSHAESPFAFIQGTTRLLPGWVQGVEGMRAGGRRTLTVPPALAYGTDGVRGFIPPAATLVYEIEVLKVE